MATLLSACSNDKQAEQANQASIEPSTYQTSNKAGMEEVCSFIKNCEYYFLATVEGDQPRVRPFGTIHIFDDKLYIQECGETNRPEPQGGALRIQWEVLDKGTSHLGGG